ncbi:MAG: leucyl/phenylalanyl-tRNA--protein transferase [Treponema sp.]|jgi:leucyl/phenylalanyl-tRNA--protein transferase|nr:leucyl/phenylalanyl-tRNA--protein transferase [Treponema sp.]
MRNAVLGIQSPYRPGPDPNFPYLRENDYFPFPSSKKWDDNIIAVGGNLSPGMLLSAYEQGIFPWYNPGDPVIWQSPDPRCVIFPGKLHISSSMQKILNNGTFSLKFDNDFPGVIRGCAEVYRPGQGSGVSDPNTSLTWISDDIIEAYTELYRLGWAHCAEAWQDGVLAGGCYGILMGRVFMGESMFSKRSNASKAALLNLAEKLFKDGLAFIDCQVPTNHLLSLGGESISRKDFLKLLKMYCGSRL